MAKEQRTIQNSRQKARESFLQRMQHTFSRYKKKNKPFDSAALQDKLIEKQRKTGRKFHFFQFLFQKHTKTGRFGRKTAADQADTIQALDAEQTMPAFFHPFRQLDLDDTDAGTLKGDFYQRVQQEMDLAEQSDFERKNITKEEQDRLILMYADQQSVMQEAGLANAYGNIHDAAKNFEPDEEEDRSVPTDSFELELAVMKPHELYLDYTRIKTDMKKKNWGNSVDEKEVLLRVMENYEPFQQLIAGMQRIDPLYDPRQDADKNSPVNSFCNSVSLQMREVGHSFVRMISKGQGRRLSSYSFGFWPLGKAVMGTVTEGQVKNPDPDRNRGNIISHTYPIRYSDYLRAAARIRGITGTPRSYSFTGYNCTSFAVEVAQAAGISIADQDSSIDIPTMVSKSQRVEMPAALQRFIEAENQKVAAAETTAADGVQKNTAAPTPSPARLQQNPLFRSLYDYYGEQIPEMICNTLYDSLQSAVNTASIDTLKQMLPADILQTDAEAAAIKMQFINYALHSEEGLQKAMGLGVALPEYGKDGDKLLMKKTTSQKEQMLLQISQSPAVMEGFYSMLDIDNLSQYHTLLLKQITKHIKQTLRTLDHIAQLPDTIRSAADAIQLKEAAAKRKTAFLKVTGTNTLSEYFTKCCTDENFLAEMVYQLQIS